MEWDSVVTIEFINLYQAEELIWNPRHPEYKNKFKVADAWENIRLKLSQDVSVIELKKKKEGLMSTYRNLYQKVVQSKKRGDIYKPSWFCYNMLDAFLKDIYKPKGPLRHDELANKNAFLGDESNQATAPTPFNNIETADLGVCEKTSSNMTRKRKYNVDGKISSKIKDAYKIMQRITAPQERDELSTYGELIAMKIRRMNTRNRAIACNRIDNILFEIEMYEIEATSPSVPQASTSQRSRTSYYSSSMPYRTHSQSMSKEHCEYTPVSLAPGTNQITVMSDEHY